MIMLGSPITAAEAHSNGLVAEVFDDSTVLDNTITVAQKLASSSAAALSFAKGAICGGEYPQFPQSVGFGHRDVTDLFSPMCSG